MLDQFFDHKLVSATSRAAVGQVAILALILLLLVLVGCDLLGEQKNHRDLLYLGWDENGQIQLFQLIDGEQQIQITSLNDGIHDFRIGPDARHIVFTTSDGDKSSAIWKMDISKGLPVKILDCSEFSCTQPIWATDGKRLLYERSEIRSDGTIGSPYLWWLDVESGETLPLLEDNAVRGTAASFSPDGKWLSYATPEDEGIYIYNPDDGRPQFFPSELGMPAAWSPESDQFVFPNLDLVIIHGDEGEDHLDHTHDFQTATHLFIADVETGDMQAISGEYSVEDGAAVWSPDGSWIAFVRRPSRTAAGRQLWLMRPDGSDAHQITDDPDINHGPPQWSRDGRYLLFQKFVLNEPQSTPGIWMLDIETSQQKELVKSGMQPQWLNR